MLILLRQRPLTGRFVGRPFGRRTEPFDPFAAVLLKYNIVL
jgi:hypothetical protein